MAAKVNPVLELHSEVWTPLREFLEKNYIYRKIIQRCFLGRCNFFIPLTKTELEYALFVDGQAIKIFREEAETIEDSRMVIPKDLSSIKPLNCILQLLKRDGFYVLVVFLRWVPNPSGPVKTSKRSFSLFFPPVSSPPWAICKWIIRSQN